MKKYVTKTKDINYYNLFEWIPSNQINNILSSISDTFDRLSFLSKIDKIHKNIIQTAETITIDKGMKKAKSEFKNCKIIFFK